MQARMSPLAEGCLRGLCHASLALKYVFGSVAGSARLDKVARTIVSMRVRVASPPAALLFSDLRTPEPSFVSWLHRNILTAKFAS